MRAVEHLAGTWYWLDDLQAAVPRWGELALPGFCKLVGDPCKGCVTRQIASLAEAAPVALACCWAGAKVLAVNVKGRIAVYFSRSRTEDAPYLSDLSDSLGVESEQLLAEWGLLPKFGRNLTREVLRQHDVSQQVKEQLARLADVYDPAPAQVPDMYDMDVRVFHAIHGLGTIDGVLGADVIYACNGGLPVVRWFRRSTTDQDGREGESPIRGFCAVGDAVSKLQAYLDTWEGILRKPGTSNAVESSARNSPTTITECLPGNHDALHPGEGLLYTHRLSPRLTASAAQEGGLDWLVGVADVWVEDGLLDDKSAATAGACLRAASDLTDREATVALQSWATQIDADALAPAARALLRHCALFLDDPRLRPSADGWQRVITAIEAGLCRRDMSGDALSPSRVRNVVVAIAGWLSSIGGRAMVDPLGALEHQEGDEEPLLSATALVATNGELSLRSRRILSDLCKCTFEAATVNTHLEKHPRRAADAVWFAATRGMLDLASERGRAAIGSLREFRAATEGEGVLPELDHALYEALADSSEKRRRDGWAAFGAGWLEALVWGIPQPVSVVTRLQSWHERRHLRALLGDHWSSPK